MNFDRIKDLENMIDSYLKEALKAEIDNLIVKRRGNIDEAQKDFIGFVNEIKAMGAEIFEDKRRENYEKAEAAKELERQRQLKLERQRKEEEAARRREVEETLRSKREAEEVEKRRREAKEAFRLHRHTWSFGYSGKHCCNYQLFSKLTRHERDRWTDQQRN